MSEDTVFQNPTKGQMLFAQVLHEIEESLRQDTARRTIVVIGTDSQSHNGSVDFVTALIVYRHGLGGRYFWTKTSKQRVATLREKIYHEAMLSITLAQDVRGSLRTRLSFPALDDLMEIHVDVGEVGETRHLIREVVGMIHGNGFTARIKPEAYGASTVADRHT